MRLFAFAAGKSHDEENVNTGDANKRNDEGETCLSPSACELGPNPVIFAHLLKYNDSFEPSPARVPLDCQVTDMPGESSSLDTITGLSSSAVAEGGPKILNGMLQSGPTTMSVKLDPHVCQQCGFEAKTKSKLTYAFILLFISINAEMF
jgi:hypothetical protein